MKKKMYVTFTFNKLILALISIILFLTFFLGYDIVKSYVSASAKLNEDSPVIIIDAGHGGIDGGTVSDKGYVEKDINLNIAKKLNNLFILNGYETIMIRDEDKLIYDENCTTIREKKSSDIHNRTDLVNSTNNAVLISIHQNHFSESKYSGAQVFYSGNNSDSEILAQKIQDAIVSDIQPDNKRLIKKSGSEIYLLNNAKVPAVMVECGFLSNLNEAELLISDDYQNKISLCIFNGTLEFLNNRK